MKKIRILFSFFLLAGVFTACKNDIEPELLKPSLDNIEIGSGNNGIGVIGKDFHFNADVLAGDKIDYVQVKIQQRSNETYTKEWSFEITWEQYKGVKNANVHKHFDIAEDAAEGKYDFIIIVRDQNGSLLEEKGTVTLYKEENLPVNPTLLAFNIIKNNQGFFSDGKFSDPLDTRFSLKDSLLSQVIISGVKGDGILYVLLIKKSLNHRPETVDAIDFSKAIVYDVFEHKDNKEGFAFTNVVVEVDPGSLSYKIIRNWPEFVIGAEADNNAPASPIKGEKAWANGDYYFGVVYKNTTNNFHFHHYIDLGITGF